MANFPDSDTKVVLVVDDDSLIRGRVAGILAKAGFEVMTAGDNQEALAIVPMLDDRLGLVLVGSDSLQQPSEARHGSGPVMPRPWSRAVSGQSHWTNESGETA